jgi:hypothetical protein
MVLMILFFKRGPIILTEQNIPESLKVEYLICNTLGKISQLLALFSEYPDKKFIVYFANGACVDFYYKVCQVFFLFLMTFISYKRYSRKYQVHLI